MGGAASEVADATRDVVIESAIFDPVSVRRTAFRYALRSEASLRFEKGQEARLARIGAERVAQLVAAWAGGTVAPGAVDTAPHEPAPARVGFRPGRVNRLLGTAFTADEQGRLLARVGIATEAAPAGTVVTVAAGAQPLAVPAPADALLAVIPTWRRDLDVEADVAEEVARVGGYDAVPTKTPDTPMPSYRPNPLERRDAIRRALVGAGLYEVVTSALVPSQQAASLGWPVTAADGVPGADASTGRPVAVTNPLSERHAVLRSGLVASLLDVLALNERHGRRDVAIFEIGKGYAAAPAGAAPAGGRRGAPDGAAPDGAAREWWRLGLLLAGDAAPAAWNRPARPADLDDAKGLVELIAATDGLAEPAFAPWTAGPPLHPGRTARARATAADGSVGLAGLVGELHPDVLSAWDLRSERVYVAELAVAGLDAGGSVVVRVRPLGRYPGVERDLAVVVGEATQAAEVAATLRAAGGPILRDVRLFDVYRGAPLTPGEKSLAWRVTFRHDERTLAEDEVEAAMRALLDAAAVAHGARLRA